MTADTFVSTAAPRSPRGLWELLDAFAAEGVSAVELGHCSLDGDGDDLVRRLRATGLELLVHNYFPPRAGDLVLNLASPDRAIATASLDYVLRSLELAAALGAPFYSVHAGFLTDPVAFDGTSYVLPAPGSATAFRDARDRFSEAVSVVLGRAEALGLRLLVENNVCTQADRGKLLLLTAGESRDFFRAFAGRPLGLLLDTGHLNVTATTLGFEPEAFVAEVAEHVEAVHLHWNDGIVDEHRPPPPGSYALELALEPRFASLPIIVEAKFDTPRDAAAYARGLRRQLRARAEESAS